MKFMRPWLGAMADCFPALRLAEMSALWERLDGLGRGGIWEAGVAAAEGFPSMRLRYRGPGDAFDSWTLAAARQCGFGPPSVGGPPPQSFPWFEAVWDCRGGAPAAVTFFGAGSPAGAMAVCRKKGMEPETVLIRESIFKPGLWRDAGLERVFADFAALVPVRCLISEAIRDPAGGLRPRHSWALSLRRGVPWPYFLRLDMAAPFSARASQLALLFQDLPVVEVALRDDTLWAYFQG